MSSDGVEKPIDIKIIDPLALSREERDLAKFKALAREAELIEKRLRSSKGGLVSGAGAPIRSQLEGFIPSATSGFGKIPAGRLAAGISPAGRENAFLKMQQQLAALTRSDAEQDQQIHHLLTGLEHNVNTVTRILRNPQGFMVDAISQIGGAGFVRALGAVGAVIVLATTIFEIVKKQFGPGGVLDIREIIKKEAAIIPDLKLLLDIRAGRVFYSGDSRVGQRVLQNTSTESKSIQSRRYNELILGSDLSTG